jgi:hypothetical protein
VGEDLKEMDWVPQFSEPGIDVQVEAEGLPEEPGTVDGIGA